MALIISLLKYTLEFPSVKISLGLHAATQYCIFNNFTGCCTLPSGGNRRKMPFPRAQHHRHRKIQTNDTKNTGSMVVPYYSGIETLKKNRFMVLVQCNINIFGCVNQ